MLKGPLSGTGVYIDFFNAPAISHLRTPYFLTHFHTDHMVGLKKGWAHGPLYCSQMTACLLVGVMGVDPKVVYARDVDQPFQVIDPLTSASLTATLVDAGHCPGSVMVVLEDLRGGNMSLVHTGDFRWHDGLGHNVALQRVASSMQCDKLYLDTSWAHQAFQQLPTKETSISKLLDLIDRFPYERIILHSHGLGDEDLLWGVAKRFPKDRFLFGDAKRLGEVNIVMSDPCDGSNVSIGRAIGLRQFAVLDVSNADHVDLEKQRFFVVKDHSQKIGLGLQGIEISCSTLWWACQSGRQHAINARCEPILDKKTRVWHVLYAMHSSLSELQELVGWLGPRSLEGICPVIHGGQRPDMDVLFQGLTRPAMQESLPADPHNQSFGGIQSDAQAQAEDTYKRMMASTQRYIDARRKRSRKNMQAICQESSEATDLLVLATAENADGDADDLLDLLVAGQV